MVAEQVQKRGTSVLDWDASIGHMAVYKVIIFLNIFYTFRVGCTISMVDWGLERI